MYGAQISIKLHFIMPHLIKVLGSQHPKNSKGSSVVAVVKLLACGARGPGFDSQSRRYDIRDWFSPAKLPSPKQPTNQPKIQDKQVHLFTEVPQ